MGKQMEGETTMAQPKTFMVAMREFFGLLPGQTSMEFGKEIVRLSKDDRAYFTAELAKVGINVTTTDGAAA